jgi:hypothetical protein
MLRRILARPGGESFLARLFLLAAALLAVAWLGMSYHGGRSPTGLANMAMFGSGEDFSWTIFITPQDFVDIPGVTQRRAIHSWTLLTVCGVFSSSSTRGLGCFFCVVQFRMPNKI